MVTREQSMAGFRVAVGVHRSRIRDKLVCLESGPSSNNDLTLKNSSLRKPDSEQALRCVLVDLPMAKLSP
jgi:hypothetical protein